MRIKVNINPKMLKWAREEAGLTYEHVCDKIGIDVEDYSLWERTGKTIPYSKLQDLATIYKRQVAAFFLAEIPQRNKKPKDFRNLANSRLSKEVLLIFRMAREYCLLAYGLEGPQYWESRYAWKADVKNQEFVGSWLRYILEVSVTDQMNLKSEAEAYRTWRNAIESKLGILVFQFSMPFDQVQGFCYSEFLPNCIVVNSRHSYTGRIFTLFHELGHLLQFQSGLCMPEKVDENQKVEFGCNAFASEFLMPRDYVFPIDDLSDLAKRSRKLKVSREAYLRRLLELDQISSRKFFKYLKAVQATYDVIKNKKAGAISPTVKSKAERGETFYKLVINNVSKNKMSYTDASEALGFNLKTLLSEI